MRIKIVFGLLLVLFAATAGMMASRGQVAHTAPVPPPAASLPGDTPPAGASAQGSARASAAGSGSAAAPSADAGPAKLMDRPLRVAALGWDLAAPAVLANRGLAASETSDFALAGVVTALRPLDSMAAIEGALARGGADPEGADVAVVPFAELTASYERLRALSPEAFFVVGWSRGREALVSTRDALPSPTDKPEGKPGSDKPSVSMVGTAGEAAAFLGLFALDQNGLAPASVHLVPPGGKPDDPPLAAVDRDAPGETARHNILLTTADASRLQPFVAVAQHGLIEKHADALSAWVRAWLDAQKKLDAAPPEGARAVAAAPGAPEPLLLLKRLGEIAPASLGDNARAFGLSGRGAVTLEVLFQQAWRIWRGAGALATPAPDTTPVNGSIVAALCRSHPSLAAPPIAKVKPAPANLDSLKVLLTFRQAEGKVDEAALAVAAGLLADVFEHAVLRISVTRGGALDAAATKHLMEEVAPRFDVVPARLVAAKKVPAKAGAAVEVLVAP